MANVLIVDDDPALREGLAETLSDLGHTPQTASSGREGLAALAARPSRPDDAVCGVWPRSLNVSARPSRSAGSSSTIRTFAMAPRSQTSRRARCAQGEL